MHTQETREKITQKEMVARAGCRRQYVAANFHKSTLGEIAKIFNCSERTISKDAKLLGLTSKRIIGSSLINKNYTQEELHFIRTNKHLTAKQLAKNIGRPLAGLKEKLKLERISISK